MKNKKSSSESKTNSSTSKKDETLSYNSDITQHDKDILSNKNVRGDGGNDQQLRDRQEKVDFAGADLDVPGSNQAKKTNGNRLRDEENKLFSQGGEDN